MVIPTFNERENLPIVVSQLMQLPRVRVLVVDDGSPDGTGDVANSLAARFPGQVDVLHRTGRRGLGSAYIEGMQRALKSDTDLVAQMDADLSHDVRYLPDMIAATATADLVIGSRYVSGGGVSNWPINRRLLSRFANIYVRVVTRLRSGCDGRLSLLAARDADGPAAVHAPIQRLLVSGGNGVGGGPARPARCRGADHFRGAGAGGLEIEPLRDR